MCDNKECKYKIICELYEDHYEFNRCCLDLLGKKEMDRKLKHLMNGNGLVVDKYKSRCYDNIKEENKHEYKK